MTYYFSHDGLARRSDLAPIGPDSVSPYFAFDQVRAGMTRTCAEGVTTYLQPDRGHEWRVFQGGRLELELEAPSNKGVVPAPIDGGPRQGAAFELLAEALRDHAAELRALVLHHFGSARAHVHEVEDVIQEALLVALQRHDRRWPEASPLSFLRGVVINVARAARRRQESRACQSLETLVSGQSSFEPPYEGLDGLEEVLADERALVVRVAVARLSPTQREAVSRVELEGMPRVEVAALLGVSEGALRRAQARARPALRSLLSEYLGEHAT